MKPKKTSTADYQWREDNGNVEVTINLKNDKPTGFHYNHKGRDGVWFQGSFRYPQDAKILAQTLMAAYRKWQDLTRVRRKPAPQSADEGGKPAHHYDSRRLGEEGESD